MGFSKGCGKLIELFSSKKNLPLINLYTKKKLAKTNFCKDDVDILFSH
jgi:hypothetical protein